MVIAYLIKIKKKSFNECSTFVESKRDKACPNNKFCDILFKYQKENKVRVSTFDSDIAVRFFV